MNTIELFALSQVSPATAKVYGVQMRSYAEWLKRERKVSKPEKATTADVLSYKMSLSLLAPATQARIVETVRAFHRWAVSAGIAKHDPAVSVRPPRAIRDKAPTFLTLEETRRLLDTVDESARHARRDRAILYTLSHGLRVAEVCALDVGDVIPPKDGGLAALSIRGKGSKARAVPLGGPAYQAITAYLRAARRLVFALLLLAVREAAKGSEAARQWVYSAEAAHWADLVGLERWPLRSDVWAGIDATWRDRTFTTE